MYTRFESGKQLIQGVGPYRQVDCSQCCLNRIDDITVEISEPNFVSQQPQGKENIDYVCNFQAEILSVALHDDVWVLEVDAAVEQVFYLDWKL